MNERNNGENKIVESTENMNFLVRNNQVFSEIAKGCLGYGYS